MTQTKEERKAKAKERRARPENKLKERANNKLRRDRPEEKAKLKEYASRPEVKAKAKKQRDKPEVKAKAKEKRDRPEEKAKQLEYMKKWREENREQHRAVTRRSVNRSRLERKQKVFSHYSNGSLKCACCGVQGLEFLTLDHIISRKKMDLDLQLMNMDYSSELEGKDLYYWLEKNNFPSGFQILCWNCNFAKGSLGKCPHKK